MLQHGETDGRRDGRMVDQEIAVARVKMIPPEAAKGETQTGL